MMRPLVLTLPPALAGMLHGPGQRGHQRRADAALRKADLQQRMAGSAP